MRIPSQNLTVLEQSQNRRKDAYYKISMKKISRNYRLINIEYDRLPSTRNGKMHYIGRRCQIH